MEVIKELEDHIRANLPPSRILFIAARGRPNLTNINRDEWFGGANYRPLSGYTVHRVADYEVVRIEAHDIKAQNFGQVIERAIMAAEALGERLDRNIERFQGVKDFVTALAGGTKLQTDRPWHDLKSWGLPLSEVTLFSLGKAPHILDSDGLILIRDPERDALQLRLGYYANVAPSPIKV